MKKLLSVLLAVALVAVTLLVPAMAESSEGKVIITAIADDP